MGTFASDSPSRQFRRRWLIAGLHPLLFALFPIFFLYTRNLGGLQAEWLVVPVVFAIFFVVALHALLSVTFRSPEKTSCALSGTILLLFFSGGVVDLYVRLGWIGEDGEFPARVAAWLLPTAVLILFVLRVPGPGRTTVEVANRIGLVLVLLPWLVHVDELRDAFQRRSTASAAPVAALPQPSHDHGATSLDYPDIYVILLDEYGRDDVLREGYGHDNGPFLAALRERNFTVASRSYSNYSYTVAVVSAMLNLDYVQNVVDEPITLGRVLDSVEHAGLFRLLEDRGYRILTFPSPQSFLELQLAQYEYDRTAWDEFRLNEFSEELLDMTPFDADRLRNWFLGNPQAVEIRENLEKLAEIAELPEPVFVFMHIMTPHEPFLFYSDGEDRPESHRIHRPWGPEQFEEFRRAYAEEVAGINTHLLPAIDSLLEASPEPPVILLLGDHGPRPWGYGVSFGAVGKYVFGDPGALPAWSIPGMGVVEEWMGILHAAYLPGHEEDFYPSISPVNGMRLILSRYVGLDTPPLEDRSYFMDHLMPTNPFQFRDVTGELRAAGG
jgi:hypothetical protein